MDLEVQIQQYLFVIDGYFHVKAKIIRKFEENKQIQRLNGINKETYVTTTK